MIYGLTDQPISVSKPTVAIAGAGGYVGRWFIYHFRHKYNIIALSRKIPQVKIHRWVMNRFKKYPENQPN
ncbi:hypothetical protein J2X69_004890 [Algoriphagus sp. 4150]|uniref:hypothetical protein n=1 Tax=Algoriphagus sp. 4150 TaxID=2817756 RepID=UPI00285A3C62|nr:hypothetical protein [Algoriphagus sp. 4150]MDR7132518.1 hypothetical protein [Algoriphagus sp. 4150]